MFALTNEERIRKLLKTLRQLEISLFMAHCVAAKKDGIYYSGLTGSSSDLVKAIAGISTIISSKIHLMPANQSSVFRRNFTIETLKSNLESGEDLRVHEGVPDYILQLQILQQRLLLLHREMALIAPPVACVLMDMTRREVQALADFEASDILQMNTIKAIWLMPFSKADHVKKFVLACSVPQSSQYALDL